MPCLNDKINHDKCYFISKLLGCFTVLYLSIGRKVPWWSSLSLKFSSYLSKVWLLRTQMSDLWVLVLPLQIYGQDTFTGKV